MTLVLVAALLVVAGFATGAVRPPKGASSVVPAAAALGGRPVVVAAAARSSAWYCPGPIPLGPKAGRGSIVLTGTGSRAVRGEVTLVSSDGSTSAVAVTVPARASVTVPVTGRVGGGRTGWAAASVELDGGGVGAEQVVTSPNGQSAVPCEVTTSSTWHFPSGSTAPGADVQLALYNPTAAPAIVSLSFASSSLVTSASSGARTPGEAGGSGAPIEPPSFQGLAVPPGQLFVIDVGRQVQLQPELAATVTATSGRVVAGEWTTVILAGNHEASLTEGVAEAAQTWWFPLSSVAVPGATAIAFWLYNPSSLPCNAALLLPVGKGATSSISVTVPATSLVVLSPPSASAASPGRGPRRGKPSASPPGWAEVVGSGCATVTARDAISQVPRSRGSSGHGRTPPGFVGTGLPGAAVGATSPGLSWLLPGTGGASSTLTGQTLALTAPSGEAGPISVKVEVLGTQGAPLAGEPAAVADVTVSPGAATVVDMPRAVPASASLLLVASAPVVVERDYAGGGSAGSLDAIGIPVD